MQFGLIFRNQAPAGATPPPGYTPAEVHLGLHVERVFSSLEIWSQADYLASWKSAAHERVQGSAVQIFCSDLTVDHAGLLCGEVDGEHANFIELWVPRTQLVITESRLIGHGGNEQFIRDVPTDASRWRVSMDLIAALIKRP